MYQQNVRGTGQKIKFYLFLIIKHLLNLLYSCKNKNLIFKFFKFDHHLFAGLYPGRCVRCMGEGKLPMIW